MVLFVDDVLLFVAGLAALEFGGVAATTLMGAAASGASLTGSLYKGARWAQKKIQSKRERERDLQVVQRGGDTVVLYDRSQDYPVTESLAELGTDLKRVAENLNDTKDEVRRLRADVVGLRGDLQHVYVNALVLAYHVFQYVYLSLSGVLFLGVMDLSDDLGFDDPRSTARFAVALVAFSWQFVLCDNLSLHTDLQLLVSGALALFMIIAFRWHGFFMLVAVLRVPFGKTVPNFVRSVVDNVLFGLAFGAHTLHGLQEWRSRVPVPASVPQRLESLDVDGDWSWWFAVWFIVDVVLISAATLCASYCLFITIFRSLNVNSITKEIIGSAHFGALVSLFCHAFQNVTGVPPFHAFLFFLILGVGLHSRRFELFPVYALVSVIVFGMVNLLQ